MNRHIPGHRPDTMVLVLAGGQGERLHPLTRRHAKPAVPFAGLYRIIDFTLSNCLNSDLKRIFVLTQHKSLSLDRHLRTYLFTDGPITEIEERAEHGDD